MKVPVKKSPQKNKVILEKKQEIRVISKKKELSPSTPRTEKSKQKAKTFSTVTHSTKRYGKQAIKSMLLSKVFHVAFKVFIGVLLLSSVSYGVYNHFKMALVNDVVVSKSEIVDRIAKLTTLPKEAPDAIVRVEDSETLKKQNDFYQNVKSGDYIVMYPKLAVIYDLRNNTIVAIKKSE